MTFFLLVAADGRRVLHALFILVPEVVFFVYGPNERATKKSVASSLYKVIDVISLYYIVYCPLGVSPASQGPCQELCQDENLHRQHS